MPDLKFDLEDDLSISDLRKVDEWEARLATAGKLRVQRSGKVLGVLISPTAWREFRDQTERYERVLRLIQDERDAQIIAERAGHGPRSRGCELRESLEQKLKKDGMP